MNLCLMEYLINFVNDVPFFMAVFFALEECFFLPSVFGNAHIPMPVRIAIALMFTFILYPVIDKNQSMLPSDIISVRIYCSQRDSDWRCSWVLQLQ